MTVRVSQNSYQNWTLTSCDTTTAKGQLSWLRRKKRIKHTGEASPGAPRSESSFKNCFIATCPVSYVRDQKNSENLYTMALQGPPYGPWWRQGSKSSTRCQYLYTVTYYMSLTFGRLKGSFLTKLVVARASSFEEARSKQRSTMESCEPGIGKWTVIWYLAMQLIVLHLTVLRV